MNLRNSRLAFGATAISALAFSGTAQAQDPAAFDGTPFSPNAGTVLDFDMPLIPSGPIMGTDPAFTAVGVADVTVTGTWNAAGDVINAASNGMGQSLVVNNGQLEVAGIGETLDNPGAGAGIEFTLTALVDEFGLNFVDQINFAYDVELFNGMTSLGIVCPTFAGAFPRDGVYFASPQGQFDRVVLTWTAATGGVGFDQIYVGNGPAPMFPQPPTPPPANCVDTGLAGGNGGNVDGVVFFDITVNQTIQFDGLSTHYSILAGSPVGMDVYTVPGTSVGNELDMTPWTLAASGDGTALSAGPGAGTDITFVNPLVLTPGTYGMALVAQGSAHSYTNGTACNGTFDAADGSFSVTLGQAANVPFDPAGPVFSPRAWNGSLCAGAASPGTNFCMANPNSTGSASEMGASGTPSLALNNLVLEASGLPQNSFFFFITSLDQGFVPNPNGSAGNLCLSGAIGRYVGMGQIQNTGMSGTVSLPIDLTMIPQPTGFVSAAAGEDWNFQGWHRDTSMMGPTSNFTDGREITITM